jgi:photosynthetic reaction center cytochrome c subunit
MNLAVPVGGAIAILLGGIMLATAGWDIPPIATEQVGFRGTAMVQVKDKEATAALAAANILPEGSSALPPADPAEPKIKDLPETYKNVQILGDLTEAQFLTVMANIAAWVAPKDLENPCSYCHNVENMADESLYTHKVARRMLQMTNTINASWQPHVGATGVTCYTCHRGQPVPANIWFKEEGSTISNGWLGFRNGQNLVAVNAGKTSLPYDHLSSFLLGEREIRITPKTALPTNNKTGTQDAEWTFALMMHMSESLGVNCTFCHNSRAFNAWDESPPQRVTAWHGIRMARELNKTYLEPLRDTYPPNRLGPHSADAPKLNCKTCHNAANKPLLGASMLDQLYPGGVAPPLPLN